LFVPALAVAAIALQLLPAEVAAALQFDRDALAGGACWRLVTAHLTHFDGNHLAWDVGVFVALGWTSERAAPRTTARALLAAAVAITLAVWAWQPQFATYRGLSGLDCTLFALRTADLLRHQRTLPRLAGGVALVGLAGKCGFEHVTSATVFAGGAGYDPVPLAHVVGAAVGIAVPWLESGLRRPDGPRGIARSSLQIRPAFQDFRRHVGPPSHHR
jgi:rhomboid family GlyGly-CTERM serine protease